MKRDLTIYDYKNIMNRNKMSRKRLKKRLMELGYSRDDAEKTLNNNKLHLSHRTLLTGITNGYTFDHIGGPHFYKILNGNHSKFILNKLERTKT